MRCKRFFVVDAFILIIMITIAFSAFPRKGDSGGPLVNAERDRLLGIVSFGFIYCGGYTGFPDGFTRVSNFTNWIADRITLLEERDDNMLT